MSQIRLRILGESVIQVGETIVEPSATHLFALLLYVAIERGKLISRGQLASMLFPEVSATNAGHNLRQLLYRLRRMGVPLETTAAAVRLPAASVVDAPESILTRGYSESAQNTSMGQVLLPSYSPPTTALSEWVEAYRDALTTKSLRHLVRELTRARQGADWTAVEPLARALIDLDPFNETATLCLAEAMARSGSKQKAVELLHAFAEDVGQSHASLSLPSRLLTKRISEEVQPSASSSSCTPFVGRADELRTLTDAWTHARRGHCTIAVVTGEKSIGKSRVLEEFSELVRMDGSGVVFTTRTQIADRARPISLFSDLCAALIALPGAAGCSPSNLPHLRRLQGAPALAVDTARADIGALLPEGVTRRAVVDLLDSVSSERPLLICVDDADHLDDSSRDLLASLPELADSLHVLIVVAGTRLGRLPQRRDRTIRLGPLTETNARQLAHVLCERASYAPTGQRIAWCVDAAAGNPGHLDLLVRHSAALRDTPAAPPDLLALLDSRIESLPSESKHVLQACVAFGADCCSATIAALTGLDGYELLVSIEALVENGFLADAEAGVACRSALIAERVRDTTTPVIKHLLHRRAALFLESSIGASSRSRLAAWRIADHWAAAGDQDRALHWRRVCWRHLATIGEPAAAAESIRAHLAHDVSLEHRADLLDSLVLALQAGFDVHGLLTTLEERTALSDRLGDSSDTRLRISADLAEARYYSYEDTTPLIPEMLALLESPALDDNRRLLIARLLIIAADYSLDNSLARRVIEQMPTKAASGKTLLLAQQARLIYHATFGDHSEAMRLADSVEALAGMQELSAACVSSQLAVCLARQIVDAAAPRVDHLEALYARCLDASMNNAAIRISARIGSVLFDHGAIPDARKWGARSHSLVVSTGASRQSADYLTLLVDLALADGDVVTARRIIETAQAHFPMYAAPRLGVEHLVYRVRVELAASPQSIGERTISTLLDWHKRKRHLGRHDDHMEVMWRVLRGVGRSEEASRLLSEYVLQYRRERRPCSYTLRYHTREDSFWESNGSQVTSLALASREPIATDPTVAKTSKLSR